LFINEKEKQIKIFPKLSGAGGGKLEDLLDAALDEPKVTEDKELNEAIEERIIEENNALLDNLDIIEDFDRAITVIVREHPYCKKYKLIKFWILEYLKGQEQNLEPIHEVLGYKRDRNDSSNRATDISIPWMNSNFVGRKLYLRTLWKHFARFGPLSTIVVVCGLGGVGKSQLAIRYAHFCIKKNKYKFIYSLNAETIHLLTKGYESLAIRLNVTLTQRESTDRHMLFQKVNLSLSRKKGWLLIFDNVKDQSTISPYLPREGGHVLITSRCTIWQSIRRIMKLPVLSKDASHTYISNITKVKKGKEVESLATMLGFLPLALVQACSYISLTQVPLKQYLALFKKSHKELWTSQRKLMEENPNVATTWNITMKKVKGEYPKSVRLMEMCSMVSANNIPHYFLRQCFGEINGSNLEFLHARGVLAKYSMINVDKNFCHIHRLVQIVTHDQFEEREKKSTIQILLKSLRSTLKFNKNDNSTWKVTSELIPHIEKITEFAIDVKVLENVGSLFEDVGVYYRNVKCDLRKSINLLKKAVDYDKLVFGVNSEAVASHLIALGMTFLEKGNLSRAKKCIINGMKIRKRVHGSDNIKVTECVSILADVCEDMGDYNEALEYYNEALTKKERYFGKYHLFVATTLNNLAHCYSKLGRYKEAIQNYERVLPINIKTYGEEHGNVAVVLNNIGSAYGNIKEYKKGMKLIERALAIDLKYYGESHSSVATRLNNLGAIYKKMKEPEKAIEYMEKAMKIDVQNYGEDHFEIATDLNNLAICFQDLGDSSKALEYYKRSMKIREKVYGENHPNVAITYTNIGLFYYSQLKEYKKALHFMEKAYKIFRNTFGDGHKQTKNTLLGILLIKRAILESRTNNISF